MADCLKKIMNVNDFIRRSGITSKPEPVTRPDFLRMNEACPEGNGFIIILNGGKAWRFSEQLDSHTLGRLKIVEVPQTLLELRGIASVTRPTNVPLLKTNQFYCDDEGVIYYCLDDGILRCTTGKSSDDFSSLGLKEIKGGLFVNMGIEPRPFCVVGGKG